MRVALPIRMLRRCLCASAFCLLGSCAYIAASAWYFQRTADAAFTAQVETAPLPLINAKAVRTSAPPGVVGRLAIPRLGLSVMVLEGTSAATLRRAAGHIAGTALPGDRGNTAISAHRDTFFRPLRGIRPRDSISLKTSAGDFRYRVVSISIVEPGDTGVLASADTQVLTLVTCYPFTFIGPAPERFVVRAERIL